jgi:hypothetical protein
MSTDDPFYEDDDEIPENPEGHDEEDPDDE